MPLDQPVAIVVLNRNQAEYTRDCLASLGRIDYRIFRIIVVDNGSAGAALGGVAREFPYVDFLWLPENLGVAGGRNAGLRAALANHPAYVLLLDNDTLVAPDFLSPLVARMESDPGLGAVQPKIYFDQPPDRICSAGGKFYPRISHYRHPGSGHFDGPQFESVPEIDIVSGCASLMRAEVFRKIGLLDETFGPYCHEDIDWSLRLKAAGYRMACEPAAKIWHRAPFQPQYSAAKLRELAKGHILFLRFHTRWFDRPASALWIGVHLLRRYWWPALKKLDWKSVASVFAGIRAGLRQERRPIPRGDFADPASQLPHRRATDLAEKAAQAAAKKKVLLLGVLAPFDSGPARVYRTLLESPWAGNFQVRFLDLQFARDVADFERLRPQKFLHLLGYLLRTAGWLAGERYHALCLPLSTNRNAFLKDSLFAGLGFLFQVPVIVFEHGTNIPALYARSGPGMRWLMRGTLGRVAHFVVLAECLKFNFAPFAPAEKITAVHLGLAPLAPLPRRRNEGNCGKFRVLFLSTLLHLKGPLTLLEALASIHRTRQDFRCTLAGGWGSDASVMQPLIAHHIAAGQLEKAVSLPGAVDGQRKLDLLGDADLFVFPTLGDSYGIVLLEAMRAGLPIVASRVGAVPEIVSDGSNGFLCEPGKADELAEKIVALLDHPELCRQMSANNRRRFEQFFTAEQFAGRMAGVFDSVIAEAEDAFKHPEAAGI
jgi:GT2 family glycosyltransferase